MSCKMEGTKEGTKKLAGEVSLEILPLGNKEKFFIQSFLLLIYASVLCGYR